jgi:signal transduction histidine kinase
MLRVSFASLRSRAIILVMLAILPLLALTLYSYFDERDRAIREVQRDELVAARNLAIIHETLIRSTRQFLENLAQQPPVQQRNRDDCNALFEKLFAENPQYAVIAAAEPEGRVFASAPVASEPLNIADRPYFQETVHNQTFFVGEPVLDRISKKYTINLSYPLLDNAGRLQGVVVAGVDLQWLGSLLAKNELPPGAASGLVDPSGKVLFRYPEPLVYSGKMSSEALVKAIAGRDEGVAEGVGLPGDLRLYGFARLSSPWQELSVVIGLPKKWAVAKADRDLWRNLIWLGLVAILSLAAAWYGSDIFIRREVNKLLGVTRRLTGGDLAVRTGAPYRGGELGQLAQAFDHMADSLQGRDAELKRQVRDLDRRTAELEAANQELSNFTYSVAHDLRAPLRSIGGFARVLLEDYLDKLDDNGKRYLNIIHQDARKMGQLIDDLLALARLGRKELTLAAIDMTELAQGVFEELKASHAARKVQIDLKSLPAAWADRAMLRQALANLLQNALKFTRDRDPALIEVSGWSEAQENVYCVKDNGVGFDMQYVQKLFEVFQRLHSEEEFPGTGVGLAAVKRIIDRHGGRLWAEGQVNEGAAFYFALPKRNSA